MDGKLCAKHFNGNQFHPERGGERLQQHHQHEQQQQQQQQQPTKKERDIELFKGNEVCLAGYVYHV